MLNLRKPWQPISFRCFHRVINYVILLKLKKKTMKTSSEVSSRCPKAEQSTSSGKNSRSWCFTFFYHFYIESLSCIFASDSKILFINLLIFVFHASAILIGYMTFFFTIPRVAIDTSRILYYLRTSSLLSLEFYYH